MPLSFALYRSLFKQLVVAALIGVLAGLISAGFLKSLDWATDSRLDHGWLIYLLPLAGLLIGCSYHYLGHRAVGGSNLILEEINEPGAGVPRRMAPMVYAGTVITHLTGGSAGREGAAVQIVASLTDGFARFFKPSMHTRRLLLITAVAGGFGAMFGVPVGGAVFALEFQHHRRINYDAFVPAFTASIIGDRVVRKFDIHHLAVHKLTNVNIDTSLLWRIVLASVVFAAVAATFIYLVHAIKNWSTKLISWPPLRPVVGGALLLLLTTLVDSRDYLGLSTSLAETALTGAVGIVALAFVWKLLFTSVTLGTGFVGGEVLSLFIIGALVGAQTGRLLDASIPLFAILGFVGVFAAAANTPVTCIVIGAELFGTTALVPIAIVCVLSYAFSGKSSIYSSQRR